MNSVIKIKHLFFIAFLAICWLTSCNDNKERFEDPPWLGGSSIDTLKKNANYSIFLELMDQAKYRDPIEKQLNTLFVPNNDAFNAYFKKRGINSVADLSKDEAEELFTLHLLRNPRSKFQMIYEYIWSELQGPTGEYAALFFRKFTSCKALPYVESPKYVKGYPDTMLIVSAQKLMPFFSTDYFEDYFGAADGSDYLFFCPESQWTGLAWGPSAVTEAEVRTSSGFIYFVDKVVPPQPNLEQYLKEHPEKFGLYYDILQRFADYIVFANWGGALDKRVFYRKTYKQIPNIADEKGGIQTGQPAEKDMYTMFVPNNEVLQNYLNKTVLKYYPSLDSVPMITLEYILKTQISTALALMSKVEKGFFNIYGDPVVINRSDILSSALCSNGVLYETNKVYEPDVFTTVPGRLFFDKNYTTFLHALTISNLLPMATNPDQDVTVFAPTNDKMYEYGIRFDEESETIEQYLDGSWKAIKEEDLTMFVQDHIHIGKVSDLSGEGYLEMSSKNYIHYKNNKIASGWNEFLGETTTIKEQIESEKNGYLYTIEEPLKSDLKMGDYIYNNPNYSEFADLLVQTGILDPNYIDPISLDTVPNLKFLGEAYYWTAFIPTNDAMANARRDGLVPAISDIDGLKNFLLYHFVRKSTLFDDGKDSGNFPSNYILENTTNGIVYATLSIANSPGNMVVTDHSGGKVTVNHAKANKLVRYGVVHEINTVLKY
jgi:uncharacterized surface protein with fasciclin (FAS1) repeats